MQADRLLSMGWKPHTEKTRAALKFAKPAPSKKSVYRPRKFSLRRFCTVLDQGALGSCAAQAAAQAIRMACAMSGIKDPVLISRLLAYGMARVRAGEFDLDAGTQVGTVFDVLADGACAPEWAWPHDITRFATMPDTSAFRFGFDAKAKIGIDYAEVTGSGDQLIENILDTVFADHGIAYGSMVNTDYADGPKGIIHCNPKATVVGGHAQDIVGYDEDQEYVEVMGSWDKFGEPGQEPGISRFGFDYVKAEFSDLWIVNKAPNIPVQS